VRGELWYVRIKEAGLGTSNLGLSLLLGLNLGSLSLDLTCARKTSVYLTWNREQCQLLHYDIIKRI